MALCSDSMPRLNHDCDISSITKVKDLSGPITTVINTIADRLKAAREEAGLRQDQLAKRAGVSQGTIGNVEGGTRKNPRELLAIAKVLGVEAEWLKTGKGQKYSGEPSASHLAQEQAATPWPQRRGVQSGIEYHVAQIGAILDEVDEVRRGAIAELLGSVARHPKQAVDIGTHIAALVNSKANKAA